LFFVKSGGGNEINWCSLAEHKGCSYRIVVIKDTINTLMTTPSLTSLHGNPDSGGVVTNMFNDQDAV